MVKALAWVDPVFGVDLAINWPAGGGFPTQPPAQVNDSTAPFKTLQAAIESVYVYQNILWQANVPTQGLVYALPGIYGPSGSGDVFPILMRDRVNVQGLGARGCVLRSLANGLSTPPATPLVNAFWPTSNAGVAQALVLVDFSGAQPHGNLIHQQLIAWHLEPDSTELLDGFTFEGGDIQAMFWVEAGLGFTAEAVNARITNCVFDMRDHWSPQAGVMIDGPSIGIEMAKHFTPFTSGPKGYPRQNVLIAQNTFVMASNNFLTGPGVDPWIRCKDNAVGIIDVTDAACGFQVANCEAKPRGVGSPGIYNNLFRTAPVVFFQTFLPMAMLGIDSTDTRPWDVVNGFTESNAFAPNRVGSATGTAAGAFVSAPMVPVSQGSLNGLDLFDSGTPTVCAPCPPNACGCNPLLLPPGSLVAPAPSPVVAIWDGATGPNAGVDPCFVGEYLSFRGFVPVPPGGVGVFHNDWRLVPGSPMADKGVIPAFLGPPPSGQPPPLNGFAWTEPACQLLKSMDWDAEVYGNPRNVNGRPDLGADETHAYIAAGSYGNDSVSHNLPATNLAPNAASGQSMRRLLLLGTASQNLVVINGKAVVPVGTGTAHPAWTQPPGTLTPPTVRASLPQDFRTAWITFTNPAPVPTPWQNGTMPVIDAYLPPWIGPAQQFACQVCNLAQPDNEASVPPTVGTYFASQLVMMLSVGGPQLGWSNLQFEYR